MASSRRTGTNESVSTYGDITRDYQQGEYSVWEAATDINCVTGTVSPVLEHYDDSASFSDHITLAGAITNSTYFRIMRPASGEGHDGTSNNGFFLHDTNPLYNSIRVEEDNVSVQDLIIKKSANYSAIISTAAIVTGEECDFSDLIIFDSHNSGPSICRGIYVDGGSGNSFAINCLVNNTDTVGFISHGTGNNYFYNCTAVNNGTYGFDSENSGGSSIAKNCCSSGNSSGDWNKSGSVAWTKTTCTAEGASPSYIDEGGDDFHLSPSDVVCIANGTDLSGDGTFPFDDDIDGDSITGAWCIGFDYTVAAPSSEQPHVCIVV